jgi:Ser/Thr protein kinase RdoA (MazF antagonist)
MTADRSLGQPDLLVSAAGLSAAHTRMRADEAERLVARYWGLSGHATRLATEKDDTFAVRADDHHAYILKVTNPAEDPREVDLEIQLMRHVARAGPLVPVPQLFDALDGQLLIALEDAAGQLRQARLMSLIAGTPLDSTSSSPAEREAVGRTLGRLRHLTCTFSHPAQHRVLAWDVQHLPRLRPLLETIADPGHRDLLEAGLDRFDSIVGIVPTLRRQVLHNDFSKSNIIVDHAAASFVQGIIDFGDAVHTAVAIDVATALLNQLPRQAPPDPDADLFADGRDLLRGYLSVADLTGTELATIPYLVLGRVIARALITSYRAALLPSNAAYVLRNTAPGWGQLRWFRDQSDDRLIALLSNNADHASRPRRQQQNRSQPERNLS